MNAVPDTQLHDAVTAKRASIQPFAASEKVYVEGSRPDIKVPMRRITQSDTPTARGGEQNPAITVYDTSGPYTDPAVSVDLRVGLPALRERWIEERGDTVQLTGPSSDYGRGRQNDPALGSLRFEHIRNPRVAREGANVSQMHYARRGIVTPEMEFVAIRENQKLEALAEFYGHQHAGCRGQDHSGVHAHNPN